MQKGVKKTIMRKKLLLIGAVSFCLLIIFLALTQAQPTLQAEEVCVPCSSNADCPPKHTCPNGCCEPIDITKEEPCIRCNSDDDCLPKESCSNGCCIFNISKEKPVPETQKNSELYSERETFLISDNDWHNVLPLVSVTTWTGRGAWCQRGTGTPDNVCVYPALIYHEEETSFDADSIIYFMQQYSPTHLTIIGDTSLELDNLLIAEPPFGAGLEEDQIHRINIKNYIDYWALFNAIVYVDDDYELSLLASTYASLINSPLIIQGTELDTEENFWGKHVICVSSISYPGDDCDETYTLEQLQQKYIEKTNTDKIILINSNDLDIFVEEEFQPEKSGDPIFNLYSHTSLVAPFLASSKHELILPINISDPHEIRTFVQNKVNNLGLDFPLSFPSKYPVFKRTLKYYSLDEDIETDLYNTKFTLSKHYFEKENNQEFWFLVDRPPYLSRLENKSLYYSVDVDTKNVTLSYEEITSAVFYDSDIMVYHSSDFPEQKTYIKYLHDGRTEVLSDNRTIKYIKKLGNMLYWRESYNEMDDGYDRCEVYEYNLSSGIKNLLFDVPNYCTEGENSYKFDVSSSGIVVTTRNRTSSKYNLIFYNFYNSTTLAEKTSVRATYIYNNKVVWRETDDHIEYKFKIYDITNSNIIELNDSIESNLFYLRDNYLYVFRYSFMGGGPPIQNELIKINIQTGYEEIILDITPDVNEIILHPALNEIGLLWVKSEPIEHNIKGYLTIISHPIAIPIKIETDGMPWSTDSMYTDIDDDSYPDLAWGRITGITIPDVSSYATRSIFHNKIEKNINVSVVQSSADLGAGPEYAENMASLFNESGYEANWIYDPETAHTFENHYWYKKYLIHYMDHGSSSWAGISSSDLPEQKMTMIFNDACLTCSKYNINSFCMNAIRNGAISHLGAIGVVMKGPSYLYKKELNGIFYEILDLGMAYATSRDVSYLSLFGDPTLNLNVPYYFNEPLEEPNDGGPS